MWFFLSTAVLKCCYQTNSKKKNITPMIQSWTQHTHLCSSYFNHCLKSIKSINPRSSACSDSHPTAKHWVISWPLPKFTNTHLRWAPIPAWDQQNPVSPFMQRAHKQVLEPNNASCWWWICLFNDKAPFSITRYQLKAKSAGKSSWYRSAVSPAKKAATWIPAPANHRDVNPRQL